MVAPVIVGIDLHNIRDGGGVNYIGNLLRAADPERDGLERVHLFASPQNLENFPDRPFITRHGFEALAASLPKRLACAFGTLPRRARELGCDVLYAPGGIAFGQFRPYATISRNMMPFRRDLWSLYRPLSPEWLRLRVLSRLNARTFARADGTIFLTDSARRAITPHLRGTPRRVAVINHGVDAGRFTPGERRPMPARDEEIRLVYPSRFEPYKHQIEVLEAVAGLRTEFPRLSVTFAGPHNPAYLAAFEEARRRLDPEGAFTRYLGNLPSSELPPLYATSDLLLFASSCENLPNILIEAMACAIPIVSAKAEPMPEVAKDAALYFDPGDSGSIAAAIREAILEPAASAERARRGLEYSRQYSWERCAEQTFRFLRETAGASAPGKDQGK
jgi:glycosyltransferase involved in cell wall biosynthesis